MFYLRDNVIPPTDFIGSRRRRLAEQARQTQQPEAARLAQLKLDYDSYRATEVSRYMRRELAPEEYQRLLQQHHNYNRRLFKHMSQAEIDQMTEGTIRAEVQQGGRVALMTFKSFAEGKLAPAL